MHISAQGAWAPFAVAAALTLFIGGEFLARRRQHAPRVNSPDKMMPLLEAALMLCAWASREQLAIALTACRIDETLGAHEWFASSLATIVPVYRKIKEQNFERLERPVDIGSDSRSLYIRKRDIQAYMRWARTVQQGMQLKERSATQSALNSP